MIYAWLCVFAQKAVPYFILYHHENLLLPVKLHDSSLTLMSTYINNIKLTIAKKSFRNKYFVNKHFAINHTWLPPICWDNKKMNMAGKTWSFYWPDGRANPDFRTFRTMTKSWPIEVSFNANSYIDIKSAWQSFRWRWQLFWIFIMYGWFKMAGRLALTTGKVSATLNFELQTTVYVGSTPARPARVNLHKIVYVVRKIFLVSH